MANSNQEAIMTNVAQRFGPKPLWLLTNRKKIVILRLVSYNLGYL